MFKYPSSLLLTRKTLNADEADLAFIAILEAPTRGTWGSCEVYWEKLWYKMFEAFYKNRQMAMVVL